MDTENVGRTVVRMKSDVIASSGPLPALAGDKILDLVGIVFHEAQTFNGNVDEARLRMMGIEQDRDEQDVVPCSGHFAVEENLVVFRWVEPEIGVFLKRPIFVANTVQSCNPVLDISRGIPVARLELIFFGIQIFFPSRDRRVFAEFKAAIDSINR